MQIGTYEASLRDRARELKRKFYPGNHVTKRIALPAPVVKPEWMTTHCRFDAHVLSFERMLVFRKKVFSFSTSIEVQVNPIVTVEPKLSMQQIARAVLSNYPGITFDDILSHRRTRDFVKVRHEIVRAIVKERPDLSFPAIGRFMKRDHTSILSAAGRLEKKPNTWRNAISC